MSAESISQYVAQNVTSNYSDAPADTGASIWSKMGTAFGSRDNAQEYQNYLTRKNQEYEQALIQQERDYQTWYDSTAVQRRVEDIKAAGLNPWLALQSGGISSNGSSSTSGTGPGSGSSAKSKTKSGGSSASSLAMLLFAAAKLIALAV